MAEKEYILTDEDLVKVIGLALEMETFLVPGLRYREPSYSIISANRESELDELCIRTGTFFLMSKLWVKEDLSLSAVDNKNMGKIYVVDQKTGGPTINLYFNVGGSKEDRRSILRIGSIGYYQKYWSKQSQNYMVPSQELINFYKRLNLEIARLLGKMHIYKSKTVNRRWLVSPEAHKGILSGTHYLAMDLICQDK